MKTATLLALLFALLVSGCARPDYISAQELKDSQNNSPDCVLIFKNTSNCATLTWNSPPSSLQYTSFNLRFDRALTDEQLSVVLWMPSMGHGSSPVTISTNDNQTFLVSSVYFVMAGDWDVRVILDKGSDREQASVSLILQ